ncbi:MAG: hypothetical protein ABSA41_08325 [Terriglobia bacterium]|jgi:hypothetical protein
MKNQGVFLSLSTLTLLVSSLTAAENPPTFTGRSVLLGRLVTGATASLVKSTSGEWGIKLAGGGTL